MKQFDLAQSFVERCQRNAPAAELAGAFRYALEQLGFRFFACCSHVDPLRPPRGAVMLHNYPEEWARAFSELDFYYIDPVFHHANRRLTPFFWDTPAFRSELTAAQQDILTDAQRFGIEHGFTIPIHSPRSAHAFRASCSVVPDATSLDRGSYFIVQLLACHAYEALCQSVEPRYGRMPRGLSRRERQCLELAAQGKSDWAAGKILGISERTVRNHIEFAKRRLGVATRVQAIVHALVSRQISFGDVIRSAAKDDEARN